MSISYNFVDGTTYGTDDINAITGRLTGAGVSPFPSKDLYNTSDLNLLTASLVSEGASLEGCKCTVHNVATANMYVLVEQGIIFFESGLTLEVDEQKHVINISPNTAGYVFAHYNSALQTADIIFDASLPADGEYVMLAEIAINGTLTDKRVFARSKVATMGANLMQPTQFVVLEEPILEGTQGSYKTLLTQKLEGVNLSKFNYAILSVDKQRGFYNLENGKFEISYSLDDYGGVSRLNGGNSESFFIGANSTTISIVKSDNTLYVRQYSGYGNNQISPVSITLI